MLQWSAVLSPREKGGRGWHPGQTGIIQSGQCGTLKQVDLFLDAGLRDAT
uniref:Uncharacterized protein n=1 Tax=Thermogemmatispora argillosa TaxID=2045280 RepID=A0A455T5E8_9CHLR|nr:hypothetical protein KTA_33890 [Thermogemmatispora argillosa]